MDLKAILIEILTTSHVPMTPNELWEIIKIRNLKVINSKTPANSIISFFSRDLHSKTPNFKRCGKNLYCLKQKRTKEPVEPVEIVEPVEPVEQVEHIVVDEVNIQDITNTPIINNPVNVIEPITILPIDKPMDIIIQPVIPIVDKPVIAVLDEIMIQPHKNPLLKTPTQKVRQATEEEKYLYDCYVKKMIACCWQVDSFCFICKEGGELINCCFETCQKMYHSSCINYIVVGSVWYCPLHFCKICNGHPTIIEKVCSLCHSTFCRNHIGKNIRNVNKHDIKCKSCESKIKI
jgi:hypothetical protein